MYKSFKSSNEQGEPLPDIPPIGQRSGQFSIIVSINYAEGIAIPEIDKNEILSYEAYDENGDRLGVFYDNIEFTHFVLSLNGTIELRIELEDYWLCGYINL